MEVIGIQEVRNPKQMKQLFLALVILPFINVPVVYQAEARVKPLPEVVIIKEHTIWRQEEVMDYVLSKAKEYGVNEALVKKIVMCEAPWKTDKDGRYYDSEDSQSRITYTAGQIKRNPHWGNVGDREKSFGVWQWHTPDNHITKEQASDIIYSTEMAMKDLKAGRASKWTCSK